MCFFYLLAFFPLSLSPFPVFLFVFYFAASSSRSLSMPPPPLSSCSFLTCPASALFSRLSSAFLFLPLLLFPPSPLPHPPFRSRCGFFFFLLWPLFLDFFLGFLFPFYSSCFSVSSSFVLSPPFLSSSFVSISFPLPSSSLLAGYSSFSSVLAAFLVSSSSSSLSPGCLLFPFSNSGYALWCWAQQKNSTNVFPACRKRRLKGTGRGDWESPPLV